MPALLCHRSLPSAVSSPFVVRACLCVPPLAPKRSSAKAPSQVLPQPARTVRPPTVVRPEKQAMAPQVVVFSDIDGTIMHDPTDEDLVSAQRDKPVCRRASAHRAREAVAAAGVRIAPLPQRICVSFSWALRPDAGRGQAGHASVNQRQTGGPLHCRHMCPYRAFCTADGIRSGAACHSSNVLLLLTVTPAMVCRGPYRPRPSSKSRHSERRAHAL